MFLLPMQKSRNNYVTRLENFECAGMQRNNAESVLATIAKVGVVSSNLIARSKGTSKISKSGALRMGAAAFKQCQRIRVAVELDQAARVKRFEHIHEIGGTAEIAFDLVDRHHPCAGRFSATAHGAQSRLFELHLVAFPRSFIAGYSESSASR